MNNTKTKQIIAGLPDGVDVWTVDNDMVPVECVGTTDDLKALAAAVPEWVPIRSEADLPTEDGTYLWRYPTGGCETRFYFAVAPDEEFDQTIVRGYYEGCYEAWMPIPAYKEN